MNWHCSDIQTLLRVSGLTTLTFGADTKESGRINPTDCSSVYINQAWAVVKTPSYWTVL